MLAGFGLLASTLALLAVTTPVPLSWLMAGLGLLCAIGVAVRWQRPGGRSTWFALALVSPILIVAARHPPAMWDDFWNWLPSAAYAYWHDALPSPDRAPSLSIFPGYPQGMQLMIAAASFLGGRFLEAAGPVVNVALLAAASAVLAEALAAALARRGRLQAAEMALLLVAGATAMTTLFNPGLDGGVLLSSYADCGTMVACGALGLLGVEMLMRLSTPGAANVEGLGVAVRLRRRLAAQSQAGQSRAAGVDHGGPDALALRDPALRMRAGAAAGAAHARSGGRLSVGLALVREATAQLGAVVPAAPRLEFRGVGPFLTDSAACWRTRRCSTA